jgi:DNA polymerase family A
MSKSPKFVYLDFEFNNTLNEKVNLVSCVLLDSTLQEPELYWLLDNKQNLADRIRQLAKEGAIFVAYSVVAEARSFYSLGLDPVKFNWIDLMLEYRCLTNHNDSLAYGPQLVNGKVRHTSKPKPKWERVDNEGEEEDESSFKPTHSLVEATYKLTGQIRDSEEKEQVRQVIIKGLELEKYQQRILNYNREDVEFLPNIYKAVIKEYRKLVSADEEELISDMLLRGRYAALTALRESKGYPIDYESTKNFSENVANIMIEVQQEINSFFPDIKPFRWNSKTGRYVFNNAAVRNWISENHDVSSWMKTEKNDLSLSLDAFTRFYDFKHEYPTDNFGAQIVRFLKLKQSLYGFVPTIEKKRKTFWDFVGPDKRVRPYMNIYGAQSSRSQPAASGFMFLKPAWMRSLVKPAKGKAMAGIDFGSQEFFVSALMSEDKNMIEAYLSGDVYLAFAKQAGMVPPNGTKETHSYERDLCKSTVLGISYLMSKYGLANKLTMDTGKVFTEEDAQELIDLFYETYSVFNEWQQSLIENYRDTQEPIRLWDGWYMFGDNDNFRSVANMPIQGTSAAIMREADYLSYKNGLYVPFTLHDALYIEYDVGQEDQIITLMNCMRDAFVEPFSGLEEYAKHIRLDPFAWSDDYDKGEIILNGIKVPTNKRYEDKRGMSELKKFERYFQKPDSFYL